MTLLNCSKTNFTMEMRVETMMRGMTKGKKKIQTLPKAKGKSRK